MYSIKSCFFLFSLALLGFWGCTENKADSVTSETQSTDTLSYVIDLEQAGVSEADSVILDVWLDDDSTAIHMAQNEIAASAEFKIPVSDANSLVVRVRIYNSGALVVTGLHTLDVDQYGTKVTYTSFSDSFSHVSVLINDTINLFDRFKKAGMTRCETEAIKGVKIVDGCSLVFLDSGSVDVTLHLSDSLGHEIEEALRVNVSLGLPKVDLRCDSSDFIVGNSYPFYASASDSNGTFKDGKIMELQWDLQGDGKIDTVTSVSGTVKITMPSKPLPYSIKIKVSALDDDGNLVSDTMEITVKNHLPKAIIKSEGWGGAFRIFESATFEISGVTDVDNNAVDSVLIQRSGSNQITRLKVPCKYVVTSNVPGTFDYYVTTWDKSGGKTVQEETYTVQGQLVNDGDSITLYTVYGLVPTIDLPEGSKIKKCSWAFGNTAFNEVGNTCDTLLYMTSNFPDGYPLTWKVVTDAGKEITDSIHILNVQWGINTEKTLDVEMKDGYVSYRTRKFGNQIWMTENLWPRNTDLGCSNVVMGDIQQSTCLMDWSTAMNGELASSKNPSGVQGVCPQGWHLPSSLEWQELNQFLDTCDFCSDLGFGQGGNSLEETGYLDESGKVTGFRLMDKYWSTTTDSTGENANVPLALGRAQDSEDLQGCLEDASDFTLWFGTYFACTVPSHPQQKLNVRCLMD